jgi:tetrahydromethanopterin S-methyltransferase subunit A
MDSRQAVGHLPGQSLLALSRSGMDEQMRIIGAPGKRSVLRNVSREAVGHFRETVEVVDLVGETRLHRILDRARDCAARNPGPARPLAATRGVTTIAGYVPKRMISDLAGYFVVFPDHGRRLLTLEHYSNDGVLDVVIEGANAAELYIPAIERELISRLDHAAYLGRELARAEQALLTGGTFVQDAAPELQKHSSASGADSDSPSTCGCGGVCGENSMKRGVGP